jgi:uncharacterized protein YrrD
MLQNLKELYGDKLAATDGEIGRVKDFYFDDKSWAIRYAVADTGTWLSSRLVLLSPHAFGRWDRDGNFLPIKLTREQIEHSPSIDSHRPVSRQYEEEYYVYYGWPTYWGSGATWGAGGAPVATPPSTPENRHHRGHNQRDDVHLRSTVALKGYEIQASDGPIGNVASFMVDDRTWVIGEIVVETGHWYAGKEILISTAKIQRISYEDSKVFVQLTKAEIEHTANHSVVPIAPEL